MRRLGVRLTLSHVAVVVVGAVITFFLTRTLAPALYDRMQQRGPRTGMGQGQSFREQLTESVDLAVLIGALVGVVVAAALGLAIALWFTRPIRALQGAARGLADGDYDVQVPATPTDELGALADDIRALGASLASTEERRVRLLGDVAHELRTPLTVIGGNVEGMSDGVIPADAEHLALIGREVTRMRRLTDDLASLSKAQEAGLDLRLDRIDVGATARNAAEALRTRATEAGADLVTDCDEAVAMADPQRIGQVVTNLVTNALRAVGPGGRVQVACSRMGSQVRVTVSDDGVGIARVDLERIFERFYRADQRQGDQRGGGSGIGLTIARQIARAHGGDLSADSPGPGLGSTFTLTLPAA